MASLLLKVRELFNFAQDGHIVLSKLCEQMADLQAEATVNQFWDAFIHHVQKSIIYFKAEATVERVMDFIANFATYSTRLNKKEIDDGKVECTLSDKNSDEEEELIDPFLLSCFTFFMKHHNAREKGVRLRCCQLVNKMLKLLGDQAVIDEDLSDSIYESMLIRIKDVYPPIRVQAVLALFRLQDPSDEECPVIDAYLSSLAKDIHPLVRKTILTKLAISRKSLPFLIERIRDVKDTNRKAAFMILSEKVSIRALSIAQRIKLINDGLKHERSEDVKGACNEMLKAWFRSCSYDFIKLLEALDTESAPECSEIAMKNLFKAATLEKLQEYVKQIDEFAATANGSVGLVDRNLLTPERVFFWYSICKHLKTCNNGELLLHQVLPELTKFCEYIRCYAEKNFIDSDKLIGGQSEFVLKYLLNIAGLLDLSDEIGRKNFHTLVHDLLVLPSVPISLVNILVKRYKDVESDDDSFIQSIVETISDIKQPLVQVVSTAMKEKSRMMQLQLSRISVSIEECKEDLECAIKQQDYQQAALLKDHISELESQKTDAYAIIEECQEQLTERVECDDDPGTILKCLTVGTAMLALVNKRGLSSTLMTLKDELFLEGVNNEDPCIRNEGIKGLGLLSLLKKEFAAQHLVFFLQVVQVDQEFVQITAIKVIFDLFLMYGLTTFNQDSKSENKTEVTLTEAEKTLDDGDQNDDTIVPETPPDEQGNACDDVDDLKEDQRTNAAESVLSVLLMFLQSESSDLRSIVVEGLAKVMITGRVMSANVLKRLILLWYNPITEDDIQLRHCLGAFLPSFSFQCRKNQELVEQAFLPTLRAITNAPAASPLSHINISNVIDLFVQLTDVRNLDKFHSTNSQRFQDQYDNYIHDSIACKISNQILSDAEDPDIKLFCKALNQLTICPKNVIAISDLIELSLQMITMLENNRTAKNMIEKFCVQLRGLALHENNEDEREIINGAMECGDKSSINQESKDDENEDVFENVDNTITPFIPSNVLKDRVKSTRSTRRNNVSFASPTKIQKVSISS